MSQPKPPQAERETGLGKESNGDKPVASPGLGLVARKCMQFRILHQEQGGRKGAGGEQEGRETERERGVFR